MQTFIVCAVTSHPMAQATTTSRPLEPSLLAQGQGRRGEGAVGVAGEGGDVVVLERMGGGGVGQCGQRRRGPKGLRGDAADGRAPLRLHPADQPSAGRCRHAGELVADRVEDQMTDPIDGRAGTSSASTSTIQRATCSVTDVPLVSSIDTS